MEAARGRAPPGEDEGLVDALKELMAVFPGKTDSWYTRAVMRTLLGIRKVSYNHWLVPGLPELGDTRPWYNVWLREGVYRCDCYARLYGNVREKRICTHVAAVMLSRRQEKIVRWVREES